MNWAISNLTGNNRVSRAILVRYSQVPLAESSDSAPQTPAPSASASGNQSSSFAISFLNASRNVPGRAVPRHHHHSHQHATPATNSLSLPLDVEETVTCFCSFPCQVNKHHPTADKRERS
ncbi:MOB kinase activator-like 2 [Glossina fuscipes fuscipes]